MNEEIGGTEKMVGLVSVLPVNEWGGHRSIHRLMSIDRSVEQSIGARRGPWRRSIEPSGAGGRAVDGAGCVTSRVGRLADSTGAMRRGRGQQVAPPLVRERAVAIHTR